MKKRKIAAILASAMIVNFSATSIEVLADEISAKVTSIVETSSIKATISKFDLLNHSNIDAYNEAFKMDSSNIESITTNGGRYNSASSSDKSIDGDFNTHWETGKPNSSDFTNEVVFKLNEVTALNRIVYAARQSSAKGKGFAKEMEIYGSITDEGEDFTLVSSGEYTGSTGDIVEIRFNTTDFKRIKFVFKNANQEWASASEFMFYKEDKLADKMNRLFTDDTLSKVSEKFNSIQKLDALEEEVKNHPLYENFKISLEDAKILLQENKIEATTAEVSRLEAYHNGKDAEYSELYRMSNSNIVDISANGGVYPGTKLEYMLDDNPDTHWETRTNNNSEFTNEVIFTLDEPEVLNRIAFLARDNRKGFPEQFEIYASETTNGDTFQLVSTGSAQSTNDFLEFKFQPTKFKRIKFKFVKANIDRPFVAEFRFYKQDELAEKMDRLFTDSTKSIVSEEFNTVEKIDALEGEVRNHPFYEEFKVSLEDARELLNQQKIEATIAITNTFDHYSNEEYTNLFKMDNNNIKSIKNNAGYYDVRVITNAIDGKLDTYWETNKANSTDFTNEVEVEFKEAVELNRIVYGARHTDNKGFAKEFEIYGSTTSEGDTYQLIATGTHDKVSGLVEAKFNPTKFKRVKFKFKNSDQNWATLSEIAFYKQDKIADKVDSLFTNGLMNELSEEFNTKEKLEALENEAKNHPLESSFNEVFELAHKILDDKLETVKIITAEQHGDMSKHAKENLKFGFGNNNQPTGISAKPGDVITVYVDADPTGPLPSLAFSQQEGSFANWIKTVKLKAGKNVITVPEIPKDTWYKHDVTKGGAIYIVNPYTSDEQSKAPVLRFASGDKFPFLTADTNEEEFKNYLIEYKKAIDADIEKNPNVLDREVLDVFEFVSDHIVWTGTATGAYKTYIEKGVNPLDTIKSYNIHMSEIFKYYGLDGSSEKNDPKYIRENVRLAQPYGYMYAATGHIGVQGDVMASLLVPFEEAGPNWGLTHEIGHKMDVYERLYGEVTNNMLPMYMSVYYNDIDKRIPYESDIYKNIISENSNKYTEGGYFENLAVYWQLEMYNPGYWAKLNKLYRERTISLGNEDTNNVKMQYLIKFSSEVVGEDLSEYFARHGFEVNEETRQETSKYKKPDKKIWYLNNSKVNYEGNGFTQDTNLDVTLNRLENSVQLTFKVDNNVKSDLLGYEILKDGELIGFTSTNSFIDTNADTTKNSKYEVIPYDINLGTGESIVVNSLGANIKIQQNKITLKLGEEFNPLEYVKVLSYEGNDITSNVEVEENVDTSQKGDYEVKYKVSDEDIEVEKIVKVEVVSDYDYLSDEEWTSVETQWGTPRRNTNIKGRVNGEVKDFEKGFGIHANGTITYDLSGKEYDYFEALLGVDGSLDAQNKSSIKFEVIADGKVLATTDVLKHADNMEYINVPVKGVQELVIKVNDAGNGNELDHTIIVNPKLTTNNGKPKITVNDKAYKIGEAVNFNEGVTAIDAEDGDLTSNIEIISNSYEEGKVGRFEVVYKVTDKDNNTTEKKSYITVYEDYTVVKSKYGQFDKLNEYNEQFKVPVVSATNNGGNYPHSPLERAIDNNRDTHWETGKPNSSSFENEVIFDLGETTEINRIAYAARKGGKGFAKKFEIYISTEAEGNDFRLAGKGEYNGSINDVIEFKIDKTNARRVKFKFIEASDNWASIGEISFYKVDALAEKIDNLFTDSTKTKVSEDYNTLDKVQALREEVKGHLGAEFFEESLKKAEELIMAKFPVLNIPKSISTKVGEEINLNEEYSAIDPEDGDITNNVEVTGKVNFNKPGKYPITYKVTDSDGNEVIKTRTVAVVNMNDYKYLTEYDWNSTKNSYAAPKKDISTSDNALRLTDGDGNVVSFERGIGAHATSTIIYDLTDKDYAYFSSYVGVDRQMFGSVGSVIFEVYVDGEKKFDSGLMTSKDPMKYLEVDINDAKELKLVVTDGGNGIGSDHATWGDTKLHFANEIEANYEELEALVNEANKYDKEEYTEESFKVLEEALNKAKVILEDKISTQDEINSIIAELNEGIAKLEKLVDLSEIVTIKDEYLKATIKEELNLSSDNITIGDMYQLTKLSASNKWISSLEGLEYAKNLESLDLSYNQIKDLSPLKNLNKLSSLNANPQVITEGMLYANDNKITLDYPILNRNGERLAIKEILINSNKSGEVVNLPLEELIDENGVISFDISNFNKNTYSMYLVYEDEQDNFLTQSLYMFNVK